MSIKDFNIERLNHILGEDNHQNWVNILATYIHSLDSSHHILETEEYENAIILDDNILGNIPYCQIGTLYEYSLSYCNNSEKRDNGQFYTPEDIAVLLGSFIKDFEQDKVWLDPCCGSGNLTYGLLKNVHDPVDFLRNNMILCDIDKTALLISRTLLSLEFGDNNSRLFDDIKDNFIQYDYLSEGVYDTTLPHYDYVIMNPPYVSRVRNDQFETDKCSDLYAYFFEKTIRNSDGYIAITPQSFTHSRKFGKLREILLENGNTHYYNFDNIPGNIFTGIKFGSINTNKSNSIRPSISICSPHYKENKITSLLKWKRVQRQELLECLDDDLSAVPLTKEVFPKVGKCFEQLYNDVIGNETLGESISKAPTPYVLYVPSTPRYYISASLKPLQRSSIQTLYFTSKEDLRSAYVLLNSAYFYWWWRIVDGGMSISLNTLHSLPVVPIDNQEEVFLMIKESESSHKVLSKNAGKTQENIKHPDSIVEQVTRALFDKETTSLLMKTRLNSSMIFLDSEH